MHHYSEEAAVDGKKLFSSKKLRSISGSWTLEV
jgi:hypothetical protein